MDSSNMSVQQEQYPAGTTLLDTVWFFWILDERFYNWADSGLCFILVWLAGNGRKLHPFSMRLKLF